MSDIQETIEVGALKPGTRIRLETMNSVYEVLVLNGSDVFVSGGSMRDGNIRFPKPISGQIIGSMFNHQLRYGKIIYGMRLAMDLESGGIETSPITGVKLETPVQ